MDSEIVIILYHNVHIYRSLYLYAAKNEFKQIFELFL